METLNASLIQSQTFKYRGLTVARNQSSHTQGSYSLSSPDGSIVGGHFDLRAKFNPTQLSHWANDGRENPYLKTDEEIKECIDAVFNQKNFYPGCSNETIISKLSPFLTNEEFKYPITIL